MLQRLQQLLGCTSYTRPPATERAATVVKLAHTLLQRHYESLLADHGQGLLNEFNSLEDAMDESSDAAENTFNANKNRYVNVLPYDYNRIRISGDTDYINASLIESGTAENPSWAYIATQGPLPSTIGDFWKMISEKKVKAITMLTRTVENNTTKCADYFPQNIGETTRYGSYRVTNLSSQQIGAGVTQRVLQVKHHKIDESIQVQHYHYHLWPDHGVPDTTDSIRELCRMLRQEPCSAMTQVVHCSAGIGRTGAFIAIDIVLRRIWAQAATKQVPDEATLKQAMDVPAVVRELRRMRRGMVQTKDQYELIYKTVLHELEGRLESYNENP